MLILFVDDDPFNSLLAKKIFTKLEIQDQIVYVTNGAEALDYMLSSSALPTYIFLDINMPIMDGSDFLLKMREHNINLSNTKIVLMLTSESPRKLGEEPFLSMIFSLLHRPLKLEEIKRLLAI